MNLRDWTGNFASINNLSTDPKMAELELQAYKDAEQAFGEREAARAKSELRQAVADSRALAASPRLSSVMNVRNKHLAHSLEVTRRERHGPLQPMKYGDETNLLNASIPIIERLYCWVSGKGFSIEDSQCIDQRNAEAFGMGASSTCCASHQRCHKLPRQTPAWVPVGSRSRWCLVSSARFTVSARAARPPARSPRRPTPRKRRACVVLIGLLEPSTRTSAATACGRKRWLLRVRSTC